jgi:hypothetical protein
MVRKGFAIGVHRSRYSWTSCDPPEVIWGFNPSTKLRASGEQGGTEGVAIVVGAFCHHVSLHSDMAQLVSARIEADKRGGHVRKLEGVRLFEVHGCRKSHA